MGDALALAQRPHADVARLLPAGLVLASQPHRVDGEARLGPAHRLDIRAVEHQYHLGGRVVQVEEILEHLLHVLAAAGRHGDHDTYVEVSHRKASPVLDLGQR